MARASQDSGICVAIICATSLRAAWRRPFLSNLFRSRVRPGAQTSDAWRAAFSGGQGGCRNVLRVLTQPRWQRGRRLCFDVQDSNLQLHKVQLENCRPELAALQTWGVGSFLAFAADIPPEPEAGVFVCASPLDVDLLSPADPRVVSQQPPWPPLNAARQASDVCAPGRTRDLNKLLKKGRRHAARKEVAQMIATQMPLSCEARAIEIQRLVDLGYFESALQNIGKLEETEEAAANDPQMQLLKYACLAGLQQFPAALNLLQSLETLPLGVSRKYLGNEIARCTQFVKQAAGKDLPAIDALREQVCVHFGDAKVADFFSDSCKITHLGPTRGNGVVAVRKLAQGDLVCMSKAIAVGMQWSAKNATEEPLLVEELCRAIIRNPAYTGGKIEQLCGSATPILARDDTGHLLNVDPEAVLAVCAVNQFSFEQLEDDIGFITSASMGGQSRLRKAVSSDLVGIFHIPSFFNHACLPNCVRFFVGDCVFIKAAVDINPGEELTIGYVAFDAPLHERQQALAKWGFDCACELCTTQSKEDPAIRHRRDQLLNSYSQTVDMSTATNPRTRRALYNQIAALQQLVADMDELALSRECAFCLNVPIMVLATALETNNQYTEAMEMWHRIVASLTRGSTYLVEPLTVLALRKESWLARELGLQERATATHQLAEDFLSILGGSPEDLISDAASQ
eukprot:Gregarina_sp_Pseudo_9__5627@NODE_77_length_4560_cov_7_827251_g71_i0_p1_GENE_NODE_77_length_4560_cov_7_827251_g71_i0NODE_77_length_4560_cov_7_827251_g71_i0_p1_ORF_typecomplete_len684_score155_91SET/PF00856_28/1_4e13TPR_19/PF14559_6/59TPR_19/PF14559_6/42_NODE_77_length_4560_cov_7_827251_g71_i019744025